MKTVNLIITGGIAATKAEKLYQLLQKEYKVNVIMTENAEHFTDIKPDVLFEAPIFAEGEKLDAHTYGEHIKIIRQSSLNIVYPATYNFIGKIANGIADDFASLVFSVSNAKTLLFPSMNENMYTNPIFQKNKEILLNNPLVLWYEPLVGALASRDVGVGRALEPEDVFAKISNYLANFPNLEGKKVMLNLGRTKSYIDKVRYISNHSSGTLGIALKNVLAGQVGELYTCFGDTDLPIYENAHSFYCPTNNEMLAKMEELYAKMDVVICCAALNDFEVTNYVDAKIAKREAGADPVIELEQAVDVLYTLGQKKKNQFLVGFSLANDFNVEKAQAKLIEKNLDMIVLNVTSAMNSSDSQVKLIMKNGDVIEVGQAPKEDIAVAIVSAINNQI